AAGCGSEYPIQPQPMIAVTDVPASSRWYQQVLGARSGHGGDEYEQIVDAGGRILLQLHDWNTREHPAPGGSAGPAVRPRRAAVARHRRLPTRPRPHPALPDPDPRRPAREPQRPPPRDLAPRPGRLRGRHRQADGGCVTLPSRRLCPRTEAAATSTPADPCEKLPSDIRCE